MLYAMFDSHREFFVLDDQRVVSAELEVVKVIPEIEGLPSEIPQLRIACDRVLSLNNRFDRLLVNGCGGVINLKFFFILLQRLILVEDLEKFIA